MMSLMYADLADGALDGEQRFQQRLEELQVEGVGTVGLGIGRVIVDFDEEAVDARGDSGAREQRNVLGLAAADAVGRRGLLHGVGGVKDDGRKPPHDGQRTEIDNQVVIAEGCAALGKEDSLVARGVDFLNAMAHIPWSDELAFLDVVRAAGFTGGHQQVGLAAQKSGNLEDIDSLGCDFAVGRLVDISENGQAGIFGNAAKDARAFIEAGTAKALDAGAIRFVVAGFEDEWNAKIGGNALHSFGNRTGVVLRLDDAGTGNEEEPT